MPLDLFLCAVTKPTVGKVVTQFVVNKISSLPQGLPSVSGPQLVGSVQKLTVSPTQLVVIGSAPPPQSPGLERAAGAGASISLTMAPDEPPWAGGHVLVPARSSLSHPLPSSHSSGCTGTSAATLVKVPVAKPPSSIALLSVLPDQPKGKPGCHVVLSICSLSVWSSKLSSPPSLATPSGQGPALHPHCIPLPVLCSGLMCPSMCSHERPAFTPLSRLHPSAGLCV